jgi:outer membrane protein TolC
MNNRYLMLALAAGAALALGGPSSARDWPKGVSPRPEPKSAPEALKARDNPAAMSAEQLLDAVEKVREQKAELDRTEQALLDALQQQMERLQARRDARDRTVGTGKPGDPGTATLTVTDFVRPARQMTLRECIILALAQGSAGAQTPNAASNGAAADFKIDTPAERKPEGAIGTEGLLRARIRVDQARAKLDGQINYVLVNVEAAYWNLYAAHHNLSANEEGLRQACEGYRFTNIRVINGTDPPARLDQIQAQFHRFQRQVYQARAQVLESERQLRGLLGLRSDDGVRLVPVDEPNLVPYKPDFQEAVNDAITLRPELVLARQDVLSRGLLLRPQETPRCPGLRGSGSSNTDGPGTRPGGPAADSDPKANSAVPGNALAPFAGNKFDGWAFSRIDLPVGCRDASGPVQKTQPQPAPSSVELCDAERKAIEYLALQYRRVIETHTEIAPARAEREALQKYLARIREVIRIGSWTSQFFLDYLTVQQQLATAVATEAQARANYNIALASFEFARGTIQQYNGVSSGEGPLPPRASKRADQPPVGRPVTPPDGTSAPKLPPGGPEHK